MGTHGTKASSPELLATWRGLAAQGSMGQEAREGRWAEVAEGAVPKHGNAWHKGQLPWALATWRGFAAQGSMGQEAKRDVGRREHRGTSIKCRLIVDIRQIQEE
ncbi:hypothetical protein BJY52DRAFT_1227852 [Lactarius psammicola]|nr:hypothetical protein BJY52DRAFT_1227852 [Lactarius psammicola]